MSDPSYERRALALSQFLALVAVGIGWVGLIASLSGIEELNVPAVGGITMKTNTALCLLVCGLALLALVRGATGTRRAASRSAAPSGAARSGRAAGLEWALGVDLAIDELLASQRTGALATPHPNRMAATTAVAFLMLGDVLAMQLTSRDRMPRLTTGGPLVARP